MMMMMMNTKKNQQKRLDRRNAIKNIDYDASLSPSPSSSSFEGQSRLRTRSLDLPPPLAVDGTSFRIQGTTDGEFDRICRSLGLSGIEDFAIPTAAWEARKSRSSRSSFDHFTSSRFRNHQNSDKFGVGSGEEDGLSDVFEAKVGVSGDRLKNGLNSAKIIEAGVRQNDEYDQLNIVKNSVSVRSTRNGGCGIKGVRPPVLDPPQPPMSPSVMDNVSSIRDEDLSSGVGDEEIDERIGGKQDKDKACLRDTSVDSESCSDTSNDDKDDDSFRMNMEPLYSISPNGSFKRNIKSWQKGECLGSGSFGTVYEGFTDDGFFFAVKEVSLLDQGSQGKQSILQLEQEISLLSQFEHENIVQYLGTDKVDNKLYIFLELVTKGSLASLYQKYHLRDPQVSLYTRQILNGLNYLHSQNVVHRDIKCANILVDASGSVKLADFGLAKATKLNDVKSCKGTAFWMAPEVVNQKDGYGLAADIWSLGCTVLEMLTRQIPYSHLEGMAALFRIGKGEPPPIPNSLSSDAQDFIFRCLKVNPNYRPTAAELLNHPFVKRPLSTFSSPASPYYNGTRA
ncbi:hypothetical protein ACSBR1_022673 [Camellia fascicularis]